MHWATRGVINFYNTGVSSGVMYVNMYKNQKESEFATKQPFHFTYLYIGTYI
jgi:hypothetical protein